LATGIIESGRAAERFVGPIVGLVAAALNARGAIRFVSVTVKEAPASAS